MKKTIFVFIAIFLLFALRLQFLPKLDLKNGQMVKVTGVLREEPQVSGNQQTFKLGHFEAVAAKYPEFYYGDEIEITGRVKVRPIIALNLPLTSFNRYQLLEPTVNVTLSSRARSETTSRGIPSNQERRDSSTAVGMTGDFAWNDNKYSIKRLAIALKSKILNVYKKSFPPVYDGIMAGVVLGDKSLIQKDFWEKLKVTGTLHMMVASGMNIAMFSEGLLKIICTIFVRKISLLVLISLIWFYTLMAGFQAPIVRAAIMASFLYLGQFFGRQTEGKRILWATGLLMVFLSPELLFDIGFQLSFLATAGLVYIQPKLKNSVIASDSHVIPTERAESERVEESLRDIRRDASISVGMTETALGMTEICKETPCKLARSLLAGLAGILKSDNFTSSISAQLATLPILLLNFGSLNLISPLINLAVLWTIPFILQAGMGLGILGMIGDIGEMVEKIASYLLYPLLFYLEQVIAWSAKLTIFQIEFPKIGWWFAVIYYFILWLWIKYTNKHE